MPRTPKLSTRIPTPTTPADDVEPTSRQINVRLDAVTLQRLKRCAEDTVFHGGAPVNVALAVRKAIGTYLSAYELERPPTLPRV